jgi:hypothetical protein
MVSHFSGGILMIKYFCDECGEEIDRDNQFEIQEFKVGKHVVRVTVEDTTTATDCLCRFCVLKTVGRIDTRLPNVKLSGDALEVKYARQSTENHCY